MKPKLIILTLIVAITVVFLGFAQSSYAQQNTPLIKQKIQQQKSNEFKEMKEMMERRFINSPAIRMEGFIKSLNLSEEQITEINKTLLDFQKDTVELRNSIQIRELEVKALLLEPQTELVKIRVKLEEIADLQVELKVKTIEKYLEVKDLLTSEQQTKLPLGIPSQIFAVEKLGSNIMNRSFCW
ncbi:periplasmic heavy metal sensor [bacterium]|nr:periplasmic heavy metal sensor [bacterium]MBU4362282.1 periplasmic heavy metal sensor [bacterium]MBU4601875.1 periplasmic heavy metal sensor [bacterium]MCG2761664.1 periplasmic heavy metal sensor [Candidatus Atribacteria bacterium]